MTMTDKLVGTDDTETVMLPGNAACPGCGGSLAIRLALETLGKRTMVVVPACCMSVIEGLYPKSCFNVPIMNIAFAAAGAAVSGLEAALKRRGDADETTILAFAGDGGTVDIGIQALSGAIERGHDFIYICYDNEAYMNTGIQRSGSTPYGAWTTTTPVGKNRQYKREFKKDIPKIIAAHNIPYMATASVGYPKDFQKKVKAAKDTKGPAFIQVHAPCPAGWKYEGRLSIKLARMAHACGMWKLSELKEGRMSIQRRPKAFETIETYVKAQGRFKHLMDEEIAEMQKRVDADIRDFYGIEGEIPLKDPKA